MATPTVRTARIFAPTDTAVTFMRLRPPALHRPCAWVTASACMQVEDMIFISVDDHLVEPPHMFEGRLPAKFADRAPRVEHTDDRRRRVDLRPPDDPEHRPQRRRRPAQGGVRRQPDRLRRDARRLLRRARARQGHERGRRARVHVLPVVPVVLRAASSSTAPTSSSRSPSCRPTTTGTSTSGAARIPAGSSRWRCPCSGIPS